MKSRIYKAAERGYANYDWLEANYSFSFAGYHDPQRQNFGALRVLNDDFIKGGTGFAEHPHSDMEIISIPLSGGLKHKDSLSNEWIPLRTGEVQVMSAGTGILHSERNLSADEKLNLFQIWIIPERRGISPAYDQKAFDPAQRKNKLQWLAGSYETAGSDELKIHQDARISRMDLDKGRSFDYELKSYSHGVYMMLIKGSIAVNDSILDDRDAIGVWETRSFSLKASKDSEVLFIEVPMVF